VKSRMTLSIGARERLLVGSFAALLTQSDVGARRVSLASISATGTLLAAVRASSALDYTFFQLTIIMFDENRQSSL
jgi:hypothetical protein